MITILFFIVTVLLIIECNSSSNTDISKVNSKSIVPAITTNSTKIKQNKRNSKKSGLCVVSFVNGIYHSEEDWRRISDMLEDIFEEEVRPFYNPSSGWWVKDATSAGFNLVLKPNDLSLARDLAEHLRKLLQELGTKGRVLHIAHSGGAILTYLAAKHHLTAWEKTRIDVLTFGGGRSITHKYFKGRLVNYYARNDPLIIVDQRANRLSKTSSNSTYVEIQDSKHNTTFVFMEGLAKHPITDHSMEGPTYIKALKIEADELKIRIINTEKMIAAERNMVRLLRKQAANVTGQHHFWKNSIDSVFNTTRVTRKSIAKMTGFRGFFSGKYKENKIFNEDEIISMPQSIEINSSVIENSNTTVENQVIPIVSISPSKEFLIECKVKTIDELLFENSR